MWAVFDQSPERVQAAVTFLSWFSQPEQQLKWMVAAGSLPIRKSITESPDYANYLKTYPGIEAMVSNLQNAVHVRPAVTQYPRISKEVGDSIAAVLLGEKQPAEALNEAAQATDSLLGVPV